MSREARTFERDRARVAERARAEELAEELDVDLEDDEDLWADESEEGRLRWPWPMRFGGRRWRRRDGSGYRS